MGSQVLSLTLPMISLNNSTMSVFSSWASLRLETLRSRWGARGGISTGCYGCGVRTLAALSCGCDSTPDSMLLDYYNPAPAFDLS